MLALGLPRKTVRMESALSPTALFTLSKTLNSSRQPAISYFCRHFSRTIPSRGLQRRFSPDRTWCIYNGDFQKAKELISFSLFGYFRGNFCVSTSIPSRLACISSSAASGGGGDGFSGGNGGGGGGGDGGSSRGGTKSKSVAGDTEEVSGLSPDVIILDVGGMSCGGCVASVKRILESQPQVSSASVNLATETAIVLPIAEVKSTPDWQQQLGEKLAKHLTSCGFQSSLRGHGAIEDCPS